MNIPFPALVQMASLTLRSATIVVAIVVAVFASVAVLAHFVNRAVNRSIARKKKEMEEDEAKWLRREGVLEVKRVRLSPDARPVPGNLAWSYFREGKTKLPPPPIDHPRATFHADVAVPGGDTREMRISRETFRALEPGDVFAYAEGR